MKRLLQASKKIKILEIIFLFIVSPVILLLPISIILKVTYVLLGVVYIALISVFIEKFFRVKIHTKKAKQTYITIGIRFVIIALLTALVLYYQNKEQLFNVMLNKPDLWLKFSGIYILFSVIPQELIYRTFFVKRYQKLIEKKGLFILINAVLFSFAHIWFQSFTVLAFTFVGSLLLQLLI